MLLIMNKTTFDKNIKASELVDFKAEMASNLKFSRENLHHFCSPLFVEAMKVLFDKNITTLSCGSGKERGILPGITGDFNALSDENKVIAKDMMISNSEFRLDVKILDTTTFAEFEDELLGIAERFKAQ